MCDENVISKTALVKCLFTNWTSEVKGFTSTCRLAVNLLIQRMFTATCNLFIPIMPYRFNPIQWHSFTHSPAKSHLSPAFKQL